MIKYLNIIFVLLFFSCNSEDGSDCFKKQGAPQTKEINVESFSKINISKGIELTIKQSEEQKVRVTAGKNLINDIEFEVIDGTLFIKDNNGCSILRNTSVAQVHISVGNLEKIYSASQFSILSDGVLRFPDLILESGVIVEDSPSSIFKLNVDNESITINDNISSVFQLRGNTGLLTVNFWGGNGRLEAPELIAREISIFHRSTNDMIVYPLEKISGTIYSTGNLVLKNIPTTIDVQQLYTGHIVYP